MDTATNYNNNCGSYHNLDCNSNLAAMEYDSKCVRCVKIKHVIALRRKSKSPFIHEVQSAEAMALKLIAAYKLTRGEVMDREYAEQAITVRNEQSRRTSQSRRAKKFSDEDITL